MRRLALSLLGVGVLGVGLSLGLASDANAGTKKKLVTKAPPVVRVVPPTWPSFYVGVHFGGGWEHVWGDSRAGIVETRGPIGGWQAGFNYQVDTFVVGLEGDFSLSSVKGNNNAMFMGEPLLGDFRNKWFATLAGRVGMAYGHTLPYLKAGVAWTRYDWSFSTMNFGGSLATVDRTGWMLGVGLEQSLDGPWSAKVEYNYLNFGSSTDYLTTSLNTAIALDGIKQEVHLVKIGLNYRISPF